MKKIFRFFVVLFINFLITIQANANAPKNIIIMISDGCGYNHIDAASIYEFGQTGVQVYEQFPVKYGMSTYSANGEKYDPISAWSDFDAVRNKPTDSAASATAVATGIKTYNGAIGVDMDKNTVKNIVERLEELGKATGVITSVMFSHATPAAFVAHNEKRSHYIEIAREMILESPIDVIMGAGHPYYDKKGQPESNGNFKYIGGEDVWTGLVNGTVGNDADGDGIIDQWTLIENRVDFQKMVAGETPKRVIGVPKISQTLQQERNGDQNADPFVVPFIDTVPTLEEMTKAALNILDNDPDGFFILIEGGAIDWASHDNQFGRMIEEEIGFNRAVDAAVAWVEENSSWDETLVIVTADHETGYLTGLNSGNQNDGKPAWNPPENRGKGVVPGMEWHSGGHTNLLIPFFAKGAGSELFHSYADEIDPVRGKYIDNTEIGRVLFSLFKNDVKAQ